MKSYLESPESNSSVQPIQRRDFLRRTGLAFIGVALATGCQTAPAPTQAPAAKPAETPAKVPAPAATTAAPGTAKAPSKLSGSLRLGIHIPVTGPLAALGTLAKRGAVMAIEEINAKGGIGGQKIEVSEEDAGATNDAVINSFKRLAGSNPHVVIGSVASTQVLAASPDIRDAKLSYLFFSTATPVTRQNIPYLFRLNYQDEFRIDATLKYVVNNLKKNKIASFHTNEDYGNSGHQVVVQVLKKMNLEPVTEQVAAVTDKDLTAQVLSMERAGANAVIENAFPTITALLLKQSKQHNTTYTIMGGAGPASPSVLDLLTDDEANAIYSASTGVPQAVKEDRVQNWIKAYTEKWKQEPDAYSANGYDSVYIVKEAVERANTLDKEAIRQALAATKNYKGINYPITFDKFGDGVHAVVLTKNNRKTPEVVEYLWEEGYKP